MGYLTHAAEIAAVVSNPMSATVADAQRAAVYAHADATTAQLAAERAADAYRSACILAANLLRLSEDAADTLRFAQMREDAESSDRCVYCGVAARALTRGDYLVCGGHADMRYDRPLA